MMEKTKLYSCNDVGGSQSPSKNDRQSNLFCGKAESTSGCPNAVEQIVGCLRRTRSGIERESKLSGAPEDIYKIAGVVLLRRGWSTVESRFQRPRSEKPYFCIISTQLLAT